jgi:hypothetical protein
MPMSGRLVGTALEDGPPSFMLGSAAHARTTLKGLVEV